MFRLRNKRRPTFPRRLQSFGFETSGFFVGSDLVLYAFFGGEVGGLFGAFGRGGLDLLFLGKLFLRVLDFAGGFLADFLDSKRLCKLEAW